jgi:hypothetical protein
MDCKDRQNHFDEYLEGTLGEVQSAGLAAHIGSCGDCMASLHQLQVLRGALRQMPVEPARSGFTQAALQRARQAHVVHHSPRHRPDAKRQPFFGHWFAAGFGGVFAAGLVLWAVFTMIGPVQTASDVPMFNIAVQQTRNVSLAINVPEDMEGVVLSVDLPENFEISGYRGKQQLAWQTRLKKGRNVLTLPVIALKQGQGQLVARVARNQKSKLLRVNLQAMSADKTSRLVLDQKA